ncbi:integrase arm-type DNA-binding domain-containing protein [Limnohabitans sp.]|uniref:tyrosine-type recombinase/integrase n=1 Tax=Limnohabitans sp. TaxID=1907725 RepID=UPI00286F9531|nr:integrase arm-type DNA-binding domain-containing protein [Limnohabitans sp.]
MLTDTACKNATCPPDKKRLKLGDSGGLYLEVSPAGAKRWFLKYRKDGTGDKAGRVVETRMALGNYPAVSLAQARKARDAAKAVKTQGLDPVQARRVDKLKAKALEGDTLADVVAEYMAVRSPEWSASHRDRCQRIIDRDLLPKLGPRIMRDIGAPELVMVLRAIEQRNTLGVLVKARALCSAIWGFGVSVGKANTNIATGLRKVFKAAPERHFAAITEPARFGVLLRHIQGYQGGAVVKAALQLTPLVFQRPGEVRGMAWAEVDLEKALWTIPPERMKREKAGKVNGAPHLVPLSRQAVEILRQLHPLTGGGVMVFPGERSHERPMSDNTIRTALMALGFAKEEHTAHGFRASARTMLAERLNFDPLVIEAQLAHAVPDTLGTAYNRTKYLDQRTAMMQQWADYCDKLAAGNVVGLDGKPVKAAA